jgi:hypothetical protein
MWNFTTYISGLGSIYQTTNSRNLEPMPAIGVRCTSSSAFGSADIDGYSATFSNFRPSKEIPMDGYLISFAPILFDGQSGVTELFTSSGFHDPGDGQALMDTGCLFDGSLLSSLQYLYASAARELTTDPNSVYDATNLTSSHSNKVLNRGVLPAVVPAVLLGIWTISSMIFSIAYGFRRRWAATLDGYSMFRFGADFGQIVQKNKGFSSTENYEICSALRDIPGLVGDARPKFAPGHVTLVKKGAAAKEKLYR